MTDVKSCSFCGEEILAAAIKCKHCGSDLSQNISTSLQDEAHQALTSKTIPSAESVDPNRATRKCPFCGYLNAEKNRRCVDCEADLRQLKSPAFYALMTLVIPAYGYFILQQNWWKKGLGLAIAGLLFMYLLSGDIDERTIIASILHLLIAVDVYLLFNRVRKGQLIWQGSFGWGKDRPNYVVAIKNKKMPIKFHGGPNVSIKLFSEHLRTGYKDIRYDHIEAVSLVPPPWLGISYALLQAASLAVNVMSDNDEIIEGTDEVAYHLNVMHSSFICLVLKEKNKKGKRVVFPRDGFLIGAGSKKVGFYKNDISFLVRALKARGIPVVKTKEELDKVCAN